MGRDLKIGKYRRLRFGYGCTSARRDECGALRTTLTALLLGATLPMVAHADVQATWNGGSGDWSNSSLWSTNPNYPNNGTPSSVNYTAAINQPGTGPYQVTVSTNVTVDGITVDSPTQLWPTPAP